MPPKAAAKSKAKAQASETPAAKAPAAKTAPAAAKAAPAAAKAEGQAEEPATGASASASAPVASEASVSAAAPATKAAGAIAKASGPAAKAKAKATPDPKSAAGPKLPAGAGTAAAKALKAEKGAEEEERKRQEEAEAEQRRRVEDEKNEEEQKKAKAEAAAEAERQRIKKEKENGEVVLKYSMYKEKFPITGGMITAGEIDEMYCLSDAMPNCKIHLSVKSESEKYKMVSAGEICPYIFEDPIGTFHDLEAGEEYFVYVEEDETEFLKSLEKAKKNFAGVKGEAKAKPAASSEPAQAASPLQAVSENVFVPEEGGHPFTQEQLVAQERAAAVIQEVANKADAVPECDHYKASYWWGNAFGDIVEAQLELSDLVDAQYLIALAQQQDGVVPRWQDLPQAARISKRNVWRLKSWNCHGVPVLCLSYCWLSKTHPDPIGEQLRWLLPILLVMVEKAKQYGEHCTIGVMQDYLSYPQSPLRSTEEKLAKKRGMRALNSWYSHEFTFTLLVTCSPSAAPEHTNRRLYEQRGWCLTERSLSSLVKHALCLWDLAKLDTVTGHSHIEELFTKRSGRPSPIDPERFSVKLREQVAAGEVGFTSNADLEFVIELYRTGFENAFNNAQDGSISYQGLHWTDEEVPNLVGTFNYVAQHCELPHGEVLVYLCFNKFTESCKAALRAAEVEGKIRVIIQR